MSIYLLTAMPNHKLTAKASAILAGLRERFPQPRLELDFETPLQLLVATILAAQCTDARVNQVTRSLFRRYPRPEDYLSRPIQELEEDIRSTGFYRQKALKIRGAMEHLISKHDGQVPHDMAALTGIPGVGRKTANVIRGGAFGLPGIAVDTHMTRISQRLGLTQEKDPDKIEKALSQLIPQEAWTHFSLAGILHGRYVCKARSPLCDQCNLTKHCEFFLKNNKR